MDDTLTLVLDGQVTLEQFASATSNLLKLVKALSSTIDPKARIKWIISDLQPGSTITTITGETLNADALDRVIRAYESVGESLSQAMPPPYGPKVARPAMAIAGLLNGRIPSIRFETPNKDVTLISGGASIKHVTIMSAYGIVEGRVQTLTSRTHLRFTLYDKTYDTPVSCYVESGKEELLRDVWGNRASVQGWVTRDAGNGRPLSIRRIERVEIVPEVEPDHYRKARGASPRMEGEPTASAAIRMLRDA
jgi:hypothetical protein